MDNIRFAMIKYCEKKKSKTFNLDINKKSLKYSNGNLEANLNIISLTHDNKRIKVFLIDRTN